MKALTVATGIVFWTLVLGIAWLVFFPGSESGEPVAVLQIEPAAAPSEPPTSEGDPFGGAEAPPGQEGNVDLPPGFAVTGPADPPAAEPAPTPAPEEQGSPPPLPQPDDAAPTPDAISKARYPLLAAGCRTGAGAGPDRDLGLLHPHLPGSKCRSFARSRASARYTRPT